MKQIVTVLIAGCALCAALPPAVPAEPPALAATKTQAPKLPPPAAYEPKGDVVDIELSEYAGYAGLIVANGGLEPNPDSVFFRRHGFKVRITLSEKESWAALNTGQMAASATTVDVLAVYARQFDVVAPALIGYSRGATGLVTRSQIRRINDLKGRIIVTAQFTEADFFIRYLAFEAGLEINLLPDLDAKPDPEKLNLVFCEDGFAAGDFFLADIAQGRNRLAGCVTWAPKTSQLVENSAGQARILATSRNLLIVADILVVNRGFARKHPEKLAGLVDGLIDGNSRLRQNPDAHLATLARAFGWEPAKAKSELAKVHLANLPENLAFFSGAITAAGSFAGIYQSAVHAYGSELIRDPVDADHFTDLRHLTALEQAGGFKDQTIAIAPIPPPAPAPVESGPLLSKDIRFFFQPNSSVLELNSPENLKQLQTITNLLQISPGSRVLLRGHVDDSNLLEFRRQGGETLVRQMAMHALELSKNRALEIKRLLGERHNVDPARVETIGRGWEEPAGTDSAKNRRVEVQWFTIE
jgi:NitT/TauT family transport system substrate-binding protein